MCYFFTNPCIFAGENTKHNASCYGCFLKFLYIVYAPWSQIYPFHIEQDGPNMGTNYREDKEIFEISAKGAIIFIITASVFLLLLFYFMSSWFVWILIVLFCIGGIEVITDPIS